MVFSPPRHDPYEDLGMTPQGPIKRVYANVIQDQRLQLKELRAKESLNTQAREGNLKVILEI